MLVTCPKEAEKVEEHSTEGTLREGTPPAAAPSGADWARLVARIKQNDPGGLEELYQVFGRGVRFFLYRQLGPQDLDDKVHDTFLIVVQAIQKGDLREPDRLMGFVRTIVRRQVAAHIDQVVHDRRDHTTLDAGSPLPDRATTPEEGAMARQKLELMLQVLNEMSARDREILTRFYLHEQSQEVICRDMRLTDTQFRLLKSRAKARFGELGKKKLERKPMQKIFMRNVIGFFH
jgi:RNA polymerase sigma factor (sigma-70 family)